MKKLLVLSAIAALAACGGSDNKPASDPSTTNNASSIPETTEAAPASTDMPAPASTDTPAPASTDTPAPTDPKQ